MNKILAIIISILLILVVYLLVWPVPIDPAVWESPEAPPLEGIYAVNDKLASTERLELISGFAPEDVAVDAHGRIYGGLDDGRIVRFSPDGSTREDWAQTEGRPLGMDFDSSGVLYVADAVRGLLSIDTSGTITLLADEMDGRRFGLTDDLEVAVNGTVYFSDASDKFGLGEYKLDVLEHRPNGRFFSYDSRDGEVRLLLDSLYFANGVAVSPNQDFVLVTETWKYHIRRYWISGPDSGSSEILIDNLPGFPDGVSSTDRDLFWVALASPRNKLVDSFAGWPMMRKIVARLPVWVQPKAQPYAFVLGINSAGSVLHNLQEPSGEAFQFVSSVQEAGGFLYFGSLEEAAIGRFSLESL